MKLLAAFLLIPMMASSGSLAKNGLDWLGGCWVTPDQSSHEVWVVDSDKSLIGFSITLGAGRVAFYELLSIRQNDDGLWIYTAHPSGQPSASFIAVETTENSVVFANPDHDYPQEIMYRRDGNQLYATISLRGGIKPNSFSKIACD